MFVFSIKKLARYLKQGKIRPRLLLVTNTKSHVHLRLVLKSMSLDHLNGHYTFFFKMYASLEPTAKHWNIMASHSLVATEWLSY